jgi:hypothetical protein
VLSLNTLFFYVPFELQRRADLSGLPGGRRVTLSFVQSSLFGPHLVDVPEHSLVVTDDWWLYNTALAALNCGRLPDCSVIFALAPTPGDLQRLEDQFSDRHVLRAVYNAGRIDLVSASP